MTTGGAGAPAGTSQLEVLITRLDPAVPLPRYAQPGDAGVDLAAAEDVDLAPGERAVVRTGIAIALPAGYAGFVHPRSGLAARHGITLVNAPGTVDAGYRGEIKVILLNTDQARAVSLRPPPPAISAAISARTSSHSPDRLGAANAWTCISLS